jgi:DNA-binding transcriptional ArsR family regulator
MTANRHDVARELGGLMKDLAHPDRISIIQLLGSHGSRTVSEIADALNISSTRVSQHLAVLRGSRLVEEQPRGRQRIYSLASPRLAMWLVNGVEFVAGNVAKVTDAQVDAVRRSWLGAFRSTPAQHGVRPITDARESA